MDGGGWSECEQYEAELEALQAVLDETINKLNRLQSMYDAAHLLYQKSMQSMCDDCRKKIIEEINHERS